MNFPNRGRSALSGLSYAEQMELIAQTCEANGLGPKGQIIKCLSGSNACDAMSPARKQAEAKICYLDEDTQKRLSADSAEYQLYDTLKISRINVTAGKNDFFKTDDTLVAGNRNVALRKLPKDQPLIITALRLGTQFNASPPAGAITQAQLGAADYYGDLNFNEATPTDSLIRSSLHPIVACSEFSIRTNGTDVIYRDSCQRFNNYGSTMNPRGLWILDVPIVIQGDKEFEVYFTTVEGVAVTTNSIFAEVQLIGFEARRTYHTM